MAVETPQAVQPGDTTYPPPTDTIAPIVEITPDPNTAADPTATPPTPTPTPLPPAAPGTQTANANGVTGFTPLDQPRFVPAAQAQSMTSESIVLGLNWRGEQRAYPLNMMWFHHIANDNINGWPVLVTY